jgi:CheY-specific phosphatase CheX
MSQSADSCVPPEVVEAFSSAAITALQELAQVEALPVSSHQDQSTTLAEPVVAATIRLQRMPPGSMSLVLAAKTAANLAARYLPQGTTLTEEIIDDVACEFANVMAGQAKTILKGSPYHFHLSIPAASRASSFSQLPKTPPRALSVVLSSELGEILLQAHLPLDP